MPEVDVRTEALVARLQASESSVMTELYDAYAASLYGVILRIVQSNDVADDVLQESFLRIWTKRDTFDATKGTLFTWMLNVARNLAIDHTRSAHVRTTVAMPESTDDETEVFIDDASAFGDTADLGQFIGQLPPEQREIIDLVYFKGLTQQEISDEQGIPLGTVKSRLRLAMNALRSVYGVAS